MRKFLLNKIRDFTRKSKKNGNGMAEVSFRAHCVLQGKRSISKKEA
jgi:hypothetical protein